MPIKFPTSYFKQFAETLTWRQDGGSHRASAVSGIVLHGAPDSQSAGHSLGAMVADPWTVTLTRQAVVSTGLKVGDTLERTDGQTLTVQSIASDEVVGVILTCTANERPPV